MNMNAQELKRNRRALLIATVGVGGIGMAMSTIPFIENMEPSEAAKAAGAPVEVDIGMLTPGKLITAEWRRKPIWFLHRTDAMLASLGEHDQLLADPQSTRSIQPKFADNPGRSLKPAIFVAIGICTHLGCIPGFRPDPGASNLGADWPGGFYCPCHGSRFDLAGRVFKNVPAPINLEIPVYRYLSDTRIVIGDES
jgi:ubiquinol-cytochrome c reductase iron-sulfur subunit